MNNRIRPVQIQQVMNGYLVQVGCQTVVFETRAKLLVELEKYTLNPDKCEQEYIADHGNHPEQQVPCPTPESAMNRVMSERETMKSFVGERNEAKRAT